jgi:hypothetical protein
MENEKLALFEGKQVRKVFYKNDWWFSIIDVITILTDSDRPRKYWSDLKVKITQEGYIQLSEKIGQLKLVASDGKKYLTDCTDTKTLLRIIQTIPSPKAEPFKQWLALVGHERIAEIENPELAMDRMKAIYEKKGYPLDWIDKRARGIAVRHTLTDEWKNRGVKRNIDFAILTNEIMKSGFGLTVAEYKNLKGLKRENLRDHMDDIELILTMLGEASTTRFTEERDSKSFPKLKDDARDGGHVAKVAREEIESKSKKSIVSSKNYLDLKKSIIIKSVKDIN